jgi:formylglycine-generating enzyme required for sulfatase activity
LERKIHLAELYQRALCALRDGDRKSAQILLAQVIALEPEYEEASRYLHFAITGVDVAELQKQVGVEEGLYQKAEATARAEAKTRRQREHELQRPQTVLQKPRYQLLFIGIGVIALAVWAIVAISNGAGQTTPKPTAAAQPTVTVLLATQPPVAAPDIGSTRVSEKDGMVMAYVSAGEFLMGAADSDSQAFDNEKPQHTVYLDAFWIDKTEVTNAQYKKCVQARACETSNEAFNSRFNSDNQPVVGVPWYNAVTYCQWAGRELPTEAQWEKAARGTDGRIYPWGNQPATCDYTVMNDGSGDGCGNGSAAWPVGSNPKGASPYGALDMVGNVGEWVADWYDEKYYTIEF